MKSETKLRKALAHPDEGIRLAKLETICFQTPAGSPIWKEAHEEAKKLRDAGARYW